MKRKMKKWADRVLIILTVIFLIYLIGVAIHDVKVANTPPTDGSVYWGR